jgi:cytochrome c-type biogenesis protein CcmE
MQYAPAEVPQQSTTKSFLTGGRKLAILGSLLAIAFVYFAYTALVNATAFYTTVDRYMAEGPVVGERAQVKGSLAEGSFQRESNTSLVAVFLLEENGAQMPATYDGVLPDLFFNPYAEIVLGGTFSDEGVFVADQVLVKCPSKYQSLPVDNPYSDVSV